MSEDSGCASRGACEATNSPLLGEDFASRVCISALHDFIRVVIIVPVEPCNCKLQVVFINDSFPRRRVRGVPSRFESPESRKTRQVPEEVLTTTI